MGLCNELVKDEFFGPNPILLKEKQNQQVTNSSDRFTNFVTSNLQIEIRKNDWDLETSRKS